MCYEGKLCALLSNFLLFILRYLLTIKFSHFSCVTDKNMSNAIISIGGLNITASNRSLIYAEFIPNRKKWVGEGNVKSGMKYVKKMLRRNCDLHAVDQCFRWKRYCAQIKFWCEIEGVGIAEKKLKCGAILSMRQTIISCIVGTVRLCVHR